MNTINSTVGQAKDMDVHMANKSVSHQSVPKPKASDQKLENLTVFATTAAEVSQSLEKNIAETEKIVQEIQKISDIVLGHKLQFDINDNLGIVVVEVVDPSTKEVIREIPSEDLQRIQAQMKQAIGVLFDEMI